MRRAFDTMLAAVQPVRTAPAFAAHQLGPALRFAAWTVLPLAVLRGVIPYTHTIRFGPQFAVDAVGDPSMGRVVLDVLRAGSVSLLITGLALVALGLPYVSLARVYGTERARSAAMRMMLYRGWLIPASSQGQLVPGLLFGVLAWGLPVDANQGVVTAVMLIDHLVPMVLILMAMRATARLSGGLGPLVSYLVVVVPLLLFLVTQSLVVTVLEPWMPEPPVEATPRSGATSSLP